MQWDNIEVGSCYKSKYFNECCVLLDYEILNPRILELEVFPGIIQQVEPGDRTFEMKVLWLGSSHNGFRQRTETRTYAINDWWRGYDLLSEP